MIVRNNTELYDTCLTFLESAVERDGRQSERANFWAGIAFKYWTGHPALRTNETDKENDNG